MLFLTKLFSARKQFIQKGARDPQLGEQTNQSTDKYQNLNKLSQVNEGKIESAGTLEPGSEAQNN